MKKLALLFVLAGGLTAGYGLSLSTMVRPEVVLDFLRFDDLGLLLVMGGALVVAFVVFQLAPRLMKKPVAGASFGVHYSVLNARTLIGAAVFGIGWGICGVCPGPAIAGLGSANWPLALALVGMLAGAFVQGTFFGDAPPGNDRPRG